MQSIFLVLIDGWRLHTVVVWLQLSSFHLYSDDDCPYLHYLPGLAALYVLCSCVLQLLFSTQG